MIGGTNKGFCLRESLLYYGDAKTNKRMRCTMPLTDGKPCGDVTLGGPRCQYNYASGGPELDTEGLVFITYPQANKPK